MIATGASSLRDVQRAVKEVKKYTKKIVIMQCNTNYTAEAKNNSFLNLKVLNVYKKKFGKIAILGLSDHTFGHNSVLGAVALGARVVEKHFTDDNNRQGPDHKFSMNPVTWKDMVIQTRILEKSMGDGIKKLKITRSSRQSFKEDQLELAYT